VGRVVVDHLLFKSISQSLTLQNIRQQSLKSSEIARMVKCWHADVSI